MFKDSRSYLFAGLIVAATPHQGGASMSVLEPVNLRPDHASQLCLEFSPTAKLAACRGNDQQRVLRGRRESGKPFMMLNNQCIDGVLENEPLFLAPCRNIDSQVWTHARSGQIQNGKGLCIDVYRAQVQPGTPVITYRCTGHVNQRWSAQKPAARTSGDSNSQSIASLRPAHAQQKCLDATRDGRLLLWSCHGQQNQKFAFRYGTQTTIKVGNRCLTSRAANTPVQLRNCTGNKDQLWVVERNGPIRHSQGGCLDVKMAATNDGAEVLRFECRNQPNQRFAAVR